MGLTWLNQPDPVGAVGSCLMGVYSIKISFRQELIVIYYTWIFQGVALIN